MPYTLSMALLWVALAVLLGIVIGWLMRSVVANRQIERARAHHVDTVELERLRGRVANLEPAVAERDRLRAELADCRATSAAPKAPVQGVAGIAAGATIEPVTTEPAPTDAEPVTEAAHADTSSATTPADAVPAEVPPMPDVEAATAVIGRRVVLDDLKLIEGIGPKIEELCHGIGIRTWFDLSQTEVSLLRTMLADAGPRFRTHDPGTWPEQAGLLAAGRWEEFQALTERLDGGKAVD